MKNKLLIIGVFAGLISVTAALATSAPVAGNNAYIKISLLGQSVFLCVNSGIQCDDTGTLACKIDVLTLFGIVTVSGRESQTCQATLNNTSGASAGLYVPSVGIIFAAQ
jgi:hypothetical protein